MKHNTQISGGGSPKEVCCGLCKFWGEARVGSIARPLSSITLEEKKTAETLKNLYKSAIQVKVQRCINPVFTHKGLIYPREARVVDTSCLGTPEFYTEEHFGCALFKFKEVENNDNNKSALCAETD